MPFDPRNSRYCVGRITAAQSALDSSSEGTILLRMKHPAVGLALVIASVLVMPAAAERPRGSLTIERIADIKYAVTRGGGQKSFSIGI